MQHQHEITIEKEKNDNYTVKKNGNVIGPLLPIQNDLNYTRYNIGTYKCDLCIGGHMNYPPPHLLAGNVSNVRDFNVQSLLFQKSMNAYKDVEVNSFTNTNNYIINKIVIKFNNHYVDTFNSLSITVHFEDTTQFPNLKYLNQFTNYSSVDVNNNNYEYLRLDVDNSFSNTKTDFAFDVGSLGLDQTLGVILAHKGQKVSQMLRNPVNGKDELHSTGCVSVFQIKLSK